MPKSPSLVPDLPADITVHMVLDDLGHLGRVWREADENVTDESDIVHAILGGQYEKPVKVVAFNLAGGWCRDVTEDIARAVMARAAETPLSGKARDFVEWATGDGLKERSDGRMTSAAG